MSRIKLTLVAAAVAALAFAVTASAASAHEFKIEGATVESSHALKTENFTGKYLLKGKPFLVAVQIECTKVHESGSITAGGAGSATLEFSTCTAAKPANCTVSTPITTAVNTQLIGPPLENAFTPEGGTFTTITLTGASCSLKEPFAVTGKQKCALPGGETEAVQHELDCKAAGSELEAGAKPATFEGKVTTLETEKSEKWSAH